jgi:hypothetical protein
MYLPLIWESIYSVRSRQVIFLTDGQPFGDRAETTTATLDQLAAQGLGFYVLQITGTEPGEAVQHMADRIDAHPNSTEDPDEPRELQLVLDPEFL